MKNLLFILTCLTGMTLISCGGDNGGDPTGGGETKLYQVKVVVTPGGAATIAPSPDSSYKAGETITLSADAKDTYLFSGWAGDVEGIDNPLSLTVDQDYTLMANFQKKNYELSITTEGEGTVTERIVPQKAKEYDHGTVVELTAAGIEGYSFVKWTGDVTSTENPVQITANAPKEVTAVFKRFYLAENGVTVKCPAVDVGATGTVNGTTYTKRTSSQITPSNATTTCTSGITSMVYLFENAGSFNADISSWDVSNVTNMGFLFSGATSFNQDIGNWDVSSVKTMEGMFAEATSFNQDLSSWDVSNATWMSGMFYHASSFNQNIGGWNVSSVTRMQAMFNEASSFNQELNNWDVSNVTSMNSMFEGATSFNSDINSWDVSKVTNMEDMFNEAISFNQDLNSWDVSSVKTMESMFSEAIAFNGNISSWDVNSVIEMEDMFWGATSFNQDISSWDVSNVMDMSFMFENAISFSHDLSGWCVTNIPSEPTNFATGAGFEGNTAYMPAWGTCPASP